jgi:hypothetical protein
MLPYCNGNAILTSLIGRGSRPETLNEDLAHYLGTAPVQVRDPWPMRLLPTSIRKAMTARKAARDHEQCLIKMWEISPHLLDNIGVSVRIDQKVSNGQVAAPDRVTEHVMHRTAEKAAAIAAQLQPETAPVASVRPHRVWAEDRRVVVQGGLSA